MTRHSAGVDSRGLVVALAFAVTLAIVAVFAGPVAAAEASDGDDPAVVVTDETIETDGTERLRVALTEAPDGLAGFKLSLEIDGDVAAATSAAYPDHFGLTSDPAVSEDGRTITVEAADLGDEIGDGETDVTLAWIDVTGLEPGEADLRVADAQVDADGGSRVDPSFGSGTISVDGGSGDGSDSEDGSSETDGANEDDGTGGDESDETDGDESDETDGSDANSPDDSQPGFAATAALAAFALVAAGLIGRSRSR